MGKKFDMNDLFGLSDNLTIDTDNEELQVDIPEPEEIPEEPEVASEEIEEEEEVDTSPPANTDKNINSSISIYSSLGDVLAERGWFDKKDRDVKSLEDIEDLLEEALTQREYSKLNPVQKEYLNALEAGVPEHVVTDHLKYQDFASKIGDDDIEDESEDGENLRRTILGQYYTAKGLSENNVKDIVDGFFDKGTDVDKTKEALKELKIAENKRFQSQKEAYENTLKEAQRTRKEALQKLETYAKSTKEIIPGEIIPKKIRDKVYEGLTSPVEVIKYKDNTGKEVERGLDIVDSFLHKEGAIGRFKLAYLLEVTEGLTKNDILSAKKGKTNAQKQLEAAIASTDKKAMQSFGLEDKPGFLDNFVDIAN